jgi:hypothetical protein
MLIFNDYELQHLFTTSTQINNLINKNDAHKSASYQTANKLKTVLQQKQSELKKKLISKFQRSVVITFVFNKL